jgi:hypothetical protein
VALHNNKKKIIKIIKFWEVREIVPVEMTRAKVWDNITTDGKLIGSEDVIGNRSLS